MLIKWKKFATLLGGVSFLIVFLFNLRVNLFWTSFLRGIISFFVFFLLGVLIHISLYFSLKNTDNKGTNIDLQSSNNDNLNFDEIYNTSKDDDFKPLEFKKIKSTNLEK